LQTKRLSRYERSEVSWSSERWIL